MILIGHYRLRYRTILVSLLLAIAAPTPASQELARIPIINAPPGTAGMGGGFRFGNTPYIGSGGNEQVRHDVIPLYLYEGKYLFADGTSAGIHLIRNDKFAINALARWRFQQLDPGKDSLFEGLERRHQTLDAGFTASYKNGLGEFSFNWLTDTLNRHDGQEVQLAYRYNFKRGAWSFSPFINWGLQSKDLANYYFGVGESEATADRPAYDVGESKYVTLGINTSWQATDRVQLFGNVGIGAHDQAVRNSPLVDTPDFFQAFVGGTYMFGNVFKPAAGEDRISEWSWRVNYGYQAEENIVGGIDHGDFGESAVVDTNIGGFTLGRLLMDGKRIDYVARLGLFRHFEKGEMTTIGGFSSDRDFWSYSAYVMAIGTGYSRWSGDELFRWGFGFGASYAEQVPLVELGQQSWKIDGKTWRFLNYLEMQLDFPLRRISKAKWLQNCYLGATVVHRSGVFGNSDLLGDVAGGSDWITAHLECARR